MALIDDIMEQLSGMGFGEGIQYSDISQLSPEDISGTLRSFYGLEPEDVPAHMFQGISEDLLQQGLASTYSPQVQARGSSLAGQLASTIGGQKGQQAFGGFAGSGQAQKFGAQARDVYGKGMSEVLAQTGQQQMKGLTGIQDMINQWRDTAMRIKGDI
tara:strand:+ start:234 stop:707 length:474 start_codon:yes stop_codon:yes gene_type:complete